MSGSCDQQRLVKLPIEHLKLAAGEIEIKFSTEIDVSTETGQLAHQLHKTVLENAIKYVKSRLSNKIPTDENSASVHIEVGSSSFLGQGSGETRPNLFEYYDNQPDATTWTLQSHSTATGFAYQIISDDSSYQWMYDSPNSCVTMEMYSGSFQSDNLFNINFNNGVISPADASIGSQVFGFGSDQSPSSSLPVNTSKSGGEQDLKVNTGSQYKP